MSNSTAIARQWQIVLFLSQANGYTSSTMILDHLQTLGLEADLRTIQRDLRILEQHFPLECNTSDRPYSWRWRHLAQATTHMLTFEQAIGLWFVEKELKDHIPESILKDLEPLLMRARVMMMSKEGYIGFSPNFKIGIFDHKTLWQSLFTKKPNTKRGLTKLVAELDNLNLLALSSIIERIQVD